MSRTKRSFWKVSVAVFANVSHETLLLEDFGVRFCECLVRNAHFGRSLWQFLRMSRTKRSFWKISVSVFVNVSHETLLSEDCGVRFCECLVRNAHFGRSLCQFLRMSRTKRSFWKLSLSVFANVSYETLILEGLFVSFCECLVQIAVSVFANVSYETLILEALFVSFCECLVRNAHFGRSLCQFLRMSRTKRSFWKVSLAVFVNVSHETLLSEDCGVRFCECLVRNAFFGRSLCQFLRMSRTKRSFWKLSLSVFANVSYETLILEGLFVSFCECLVQNAPFGRLRAVSVFANVSYETLILEALFVSFCECLVRNAHFGRSLCQFLRMSRTKRSFWKVSLAVFANVSHETLLLEDFGVRFCECLVRNAHFGRSLGSFCECLARNAPFGRLRCPFLRMSRTKRSFWKVSLLQPDMSEVASDASSLRFFFVFMFFPRASERRVFQKEGGVNRSTYKRSSHMWYLLTTSHIWHLLTSSHIWHLLTSDIFSHLTSSHIWHLLTSSHIFSHLTSSHIFSHLTSSHISHLLTSSHIFSYLTSSHLSSLFFLLKAGGRPGGPSRTSTLCGDRACRMRET